MLKKIIRKLKSNKPKIFKTSLYKKGIINLFLELYFKFKNNNNSKIDTNQTKILVVSLESLGDDAVKSATIDLIKKHYNNAQVDIMVFDAWKEIFQLQGYHTISFPKGTKIIKIIKEKISFYNEINNSGYTKIIYLDHCGLIRDEFKYINCKDNIGISKLNEEPLLKEIISVEDKVDYVLDRQKWLLEKLTGKKYVLEDIRPNLGKFFPETIHKDIIIYGIGASTPTNIMPIPKVIKILNFLLERYPNKKIILIGYGKEQESYAKKLLKNIDNDNIINSVGKTNLKETLQLIKDSDFFIGYDSGPANLTFSLRKKYVCLFSRELKIWQHPFNDIRYILGDKKNPENDGYYGSDVLNSIKINQIENALNELGL